MSYDYKRKQQKQAKYKNSRKKVQESVEAI